MKELDGTNQPSRADSHWEERARIHLLLASIRRRIFLQEFFDFSVRTALLAFPLGAVAIAVNQFFGPHVGSWQILLGSILATLGFAAVRAVLELREREAAALAFDTKADLRDRVRAQWLPVRARRRSRRGCRALQERWQAAARSSTRCAQPRRRSSLSRANRRISARLDSGKGAGLSRSVVTPGKRNRSCSAASAQAASRRR